MHSHAVAALLCGLIAPCVVQADLEDFNKNEGATSLRQREAGSLRYTAAEVRPEVSLGAVGLFPVSSIR